MKKMLLQARTVYRKKWAAKHAYEELKKGIWLELALALMRKIEKHRRVARKLVLEADKLQKKPYDIGWSDESECQACHKVQKSTGSTVTQNGERSEGRSQRPSESWSKKRKLPRKSGSGKEVFSRILCESQRNRGRFSTKKWESEKHKSWSLPAESFKGRVATDGSLLGKAGKWRAGGWSVV